MNFAAMLEPPKPPKWDGKSHKHVLLDERAPKRHLRPWTRPTLPQLTKTERTRVNLVLIFNLKRAIGDVA